MEYHFYILYSEAKDRYYVGHTENLQKRITEHRLRKNLGTNDWVLKYSEVYGSRSEAMLREQEVKAKKRRSYIEALIASRG